MKIENSNPSDIEQIFSLYRIATEYQKPRFEVHWPEFDRDMVAAEINENRQWKLLIDGHVACIWAITFSDPQIWEDRNTDPAIYIHRIATNPNYRGQNFVGIIVSWAREYASSIGKSFIRLDTIGNNEKLIAHYTNAGFGYLGYYKLKDTAGLPQHYHDASACLFEINLKK